MKRVLLSLLTVAVLLTVLAHGSHNRGVGDEYYYNIAQMQTFVEIGLSEADAE